MQTDKERAEKYVRSKCPELMELSFGCEVQPYGVNSPECRYVIASRFTKGGRHFCTGVHERANPKQELFSKEEIKFVFGHPIKLNDWLSAIDTVFGQMKKSGSGTFLNVEVYESPKYEGLSHTTINFNLITGQPATEADYQAFNQIVGI